MKLIITAVVACSFAFAGAPEGKTVFETKCTPCHGPNGEGKASIAKMYKIEMHPLGSKEIQAKSDADFKKVITEGHGKMKPVTGLSDAQIADVIAHVRTLKP
jgi:cytochrome c553